MIFSVEYEGIYLVNPIRMNTTAHHTISNDSGEMQDNSEADHVFAVIDIDAYHNVGFDEQDSDEMVSMVARDSSDNNCILLSDGSIAITPGGVTSDPTLSDYTLVNTAFPLTKDNADQQHGCEVV